MEEKKKVGVGFGVMLINYKKEILLGKRNEDPKKADSALHGEGTWTMPGGKLEFGETFEEGARREVLEETGIRLTEAKVICVNNDRVETAHFVTIGLFSDSFEGEARILEPDEITDWRWFDLEHLPEKVFPASLKVIKNYREKVFYKH